MCASEVQSGSGVAAHRVQQVRTGDEANVCEREQVRNEARLVGAWSHGPILISACGRRREQDARNRKSHSLAEGDKQSHQSLIQASRGGTWKLSL